MHILDQYKNFFIIVVIIVILYFLYRYKSEYNKKSLVRAQYNKNLSPESCNKNCVSQNSANTHEYLQPHNPFEPFQNNNLPVLNLYYTEWCGWSQKFLPVWEELEKKVKSSDLKNKVKLEKINCKEENKQRCDGVPGFPFIVLNKNGNKIQFNQNRDLATLEGFINKNC